MSSNSSQAPISMNRVLTIIVLAQFFCTSLWFAANAVLADLIATLQLDASFLAHLTSAVQFGFISGTLVFAVFTVADRYSPSQVFFVSAIVAACCNLLVSWEAIPASGILIFRFMTGFFLAGIYPVGMKIASDYFQKGLGKSLGFLVGALVLGTAFPHFLKNLTGTLPWKYVIYSTSTFALLGGLAIKLFVPDGTYRKSGQPFNFTAFMAGFSHADFRAAAFGYFGHMWELYTFWAFVPVMLAFYSNQFPQSELNVPLYSFLIIAVGSLACAASGLLSQKYPAKKIATMALLLSGLCCVLSPLFLLHSNTWMLLAFLFFWGIVVIADSPLFSTLVAQAAPQESRGSALTIVNCIGFTITIISIQFINLASTFIHWQYVYLILAIGPALGLLALIRKPEAN